jgi:hypothetical protein
MGRLASEDNSMTIDDDTITPDELRVIRRNLERKGVIESRLCEDGQVRWFPTGKEYVDPDELEEGTGLS